MSFSVRKSLTRYLFGTNVLSATQDTCCSVNELLLLVDGVLGGALGGVLAAVVAMFLLVVT